MSLSSFCDVGIPVDPRSIDELLGQHPSPAVGLVDSLGGITMQGILSEGGIRHCNNSSSELIVLTNTLSFENVAYQPLLSYDM